LRRPALLFKKSRLRPWWPLKSRNLEVLGNFFSLDQKGWAIGPDQKRSTRNYAKGSAAGQSLASPQTATRSAPRLPPATCACLLPPAPASCLLLLRLPPDSPVRHRAQTGR